ncbi:MAG: hypothetical protein FWE40_05535 [Oscillospiraceae bacterium]|nr:hypothetical protein [Oscillospiraceae bacterium]
MNGYEITWTALFGAFATFLGIAGSYLKSRSERKEAAEIIERCVETDRQEHADMAAQLTAQGEDIAQLKRQFELLTRPRSEIEDENIRLLRRDAEQTAEIERLKRQLAAVIDKTQT